MDELSIQHQLPGRRISPTFETTLRLAVEAAFRQLISTKFLYQKSEVSLATLPDALKGAGCTVKDDELASLQAEAQQRPWRMTTHHLADDSPRADILRHARVGGSPIGTPTHELPLYFYLPGVQLYCRQCANNTTFAALSCSVEGGFASPFPRKTTRGLEQVFTLFYRCEACRQTIHAILTRRDGMRVHLCGFAPRREQRVQRSLPKPLEPILVDATNAVAEGDLYAGFYHLRTLIEHYLKQRLALPIDDRIRGDELVTRHYETLTVPLRAALPSLTVAYESLSRHLHARNGSVEDFQDMLAIVCDHVEALVMLSRYDNDTTAA